METNQAAVATVAGTVVATGPLAQDISAQVETKLVKLEDVKFTFRTTKVKDPEDPEGKKEIDWKRPNYVIPLPLLTQAGIMAAFSSGDQKTVELLVESVNAPIVDRARGIINEAIEVNPAVDLSKEDEFTIDLNKLGFTAIANLPRGERGAGIPKDQWNAFVADYIATMQTPEAIALFSDKKPRTVEVLGKHGVLLAGKFNQVKSRKDVVGQMLGFLDIWVQVTKNGEDHLACFEHLQAKGKQILQAENFDDL